MTLKKTAMKYLKILFYHSHLEGMEIAMEIPNGSENLGLQAL
jgi:hypothetical protein